MPYTQTIMKNYPFTAIFRQDEMKEALILNLINPKLGGVLIRGQKGTAKSTAVRALADIEENIRVGKKGATKEEIIEAAKKAKIHDFIISLPKGYATDIEENGSLLSGGQRQRISIARAFLKDAPILILDEMTSNVDPINESLIQDAIRYDELQGESNSIINVSDL